MEVARDGAEALDRFDDVDPDLVLLDVMLPTVSGIDVCRELRGRTDVPIIMVTAKGAEIDTVVGLEVGADDYVTKPYRLRELVARMRAVLRRRRRGAAAPDAVAEDDVIRGRRRRARHRQPRGARARRAGEAAAQGVRAAGAADGERRAGAARDTLIDRVWGSDYVGDTKTLDVHVKRLRSKIEDDPSNPTRIVTIRGLGYKYEVPPADRGCRRVRRHGRSKQST